MPKEITYLEAIREALVEEMRRDPKVFVLGEDVGEYGGAFGVTQGLFQEFGESRVIDTPIPRSMNMFAIDRFPEPCQFRGSGMFLFDGELSMKPMMCRIVPFGSSGA